MEQVKQSYRLNHSLRIPADALSNGFVRPAYLAEVAPRPVLAGIGYNDFLKTLPDGIGVATSLEELQFQRTLRSTPRRAMRAYQRNVRGCSIISSTLIVVPEGMDPYHTVNSKGQKCFPRDVYEGDELVDTKVPLPSGGVILEWHEGVALPSRTSDSLSSMEAGSHNAHWGINPKPDLAGGRREVAVSFAGWYGGSHHGCLSMHADSSRAGSSRYHAFRPARRIS